MVDSFRKMTSESSENLNQAREYFLLGLEFFERESYEEAEQSFKKSLKIIPNRESTLTNLAATLIKLQKINEAIDVCLQLISSNPQNIEAHLTLGLANHQQKKYSIALDHYSEAIHLDPNYAEAWSNKGITLTCLSRHEEALSDFDQAIHLKPDYAEAWSNRGATLTCLNRYDQALSDFDQAIRLKPDYVEALSNKGNSLTHLNRYDEALSQFDLAIRLKPGYAEAWSNKGTTLTYLNRYDEALLQFDQAIYLKPDFYDPYWNKSVIHLRLGNFNEGWNLYTYKWQMKDSEPYRYNKFPELKSLDNLKNKNILIWHEQGLGDTIQFSRYIKELKKLEAQITFEVQKPLLNLFASQSECITTSEIDNKSKFDFQAPLLTLPKLFNTNFDTIPKPINLHICQQRIERWKTLLKLSKEKPNIGIAVSGNPNHKNDLNRSIPLSTILPLLNFGKFFLIQKNITEIDEKILRQHKEITFLGNEINDFVDSASIVMNMDLVISVDTSLIHLAGSLNKKSYLMLPWCPEWRWLMNRSDSPWYPSIKIFRQKELCDWGSVINQIKSELESEL